MRIRALTHSGTFHADEVTAFAVLRLIEPDLAPPEFVRTRDPDTVDRAEVVFDVGGTYDPGRRRYDHHMPDPPRREHKDGPYSSAGLIWRDYGRQAIQALAGDLDEEIAAKLWERLDHAFFLPIDQIDNGQGHADALGFVSLVDELNPLWNEPQAEEDARFIKAADLAEAVLRRKTAKLLSELTARDAILEAARRSPDPRLLELPGNMPWQRAVFEADLPVLYAIYQDQDGLWRLDCMPPEPGAFKQRLALPKPWAGLREEELQKVTGVPDAVFVHRARFTGGARSRDGIMKMAQLALKRERKRRPKNNNPDWIPP